MPLFQPVLDIEGRRHAAYCGPTAIAILTGVPLSRIEKMIRRCRRGGYRDNNGRKIPIKGTYRSEVQKVLKRLGCEVQSVQASGTLSQFVDDVRYAGTYLVNVTGHFMVCCAGRVADGTFPEGTAIEDYHRGNRRVVAAWSVVAPQLPKYTLNDALVALRPPKPKKDVKAARLEKVLADIARWERKEKLAKTKLKKLRAQRKRYEKLGVVPLTKKPEAVQ